MSNLWAKKRKPAALDMSERDLRESIAKRVTDRLNPFDSSYTISKKGGGLEKLRLHRFKFRISRSKHFPYDALPFSSQVVNIHKKVVINIWLPLYVMTFENSAGEISQGEFSEKEQLRENYERLGKEAAELFPNYEPWQYGTYEALRALRADAKMWKVMSKQEYREPEQRNRFLDASKKYQAIASISEQMINLRVNQLPADKRETYQIEHAHIDGVIRQYDQALAAFRSSDSSMQMKTLVNERAEILARRQALERILPDIL